MLDTVYLNPPSMLQEMEEATRAIGFTIGSDYLTGSLLRTLAASKPSGALLELGTGTGLGTAWLLDGMDADSRLTTVDRDQRAPALARRFLGDDPRLTCTTMDGVAFIEDARRQKRVFDLIFADMPPGKFGQLAETLQLLALGGIYVVDDLLFQTSWSPEHLPLVSALVQTLERRDDLHITKLNWSTGLLMAVKRK